MWMLDGLRAWGLGLALVLMTVAWPTWGGAQGAAEAVVGVDEKAEAASPAKVWIDRAWTMHAGRLGGGGMDGMDDEDPYQAADLLLLLLPQLALDGREAQAARAAGQMHLIVMGLVGEGDDWTAAYLPASSYAAGDEAKAAEQMEHALADPAIALDAHQMYAEVAGTLGNAEAYGRSIDAFMEGFEDGQLDGVALAEEDGFAFGGLYSPWFAANAARRFDDAETVKRLAGLSYAAPIEEAGIAAMAAQFEAVAGDQEQAREWLAAGAEAFALAVEEHAEAGEDDWLDVATSLPEMVAAVWLLDGQAAALEQAAAWLAVLDEETKDGLLWETAACVHASTGLARMGRAADAEAALTRAVSTLKATMFAGEQPDAFDVLHVSIALVRQGRLADAEALYAVMPRHGLRAYAAVGIGMGLRE